MPCHDGVVALGFLGRRCYGVRAVVQHKRRTGYSAAAVAARRRPVAAAALVWSLASAPFYVVLQLSDEVRRRRRGRRRRAASAKFASNVQQARAKAVGEERPSVRSSLCPSIYYERLASRGQRRPASRVGCPAGPSQTGQHEAAAASTGLRPLASVPVVWTWWWWLFSSMHKCRTVFLEAVEHRQPPPWDHPQRHHFHYQHRNSVSAEARGQ